MKKMLMVVMMVVACFSSVNVLAVEGIVPHEEYSLRGKDPGIIIFPRVEGIVPHEEY